MRIDERSSEPIFIQIANNLEETILNGVYGEECQIPSTNELSALLSINPQTVLKGMNILVDSGIIYKKRGVGMFVCDGAIKIIKGKREAKFHENFIAPMMKEALSLGMSKGDISKMIEKEYNDGNDNG